MPLEICFVGLIKKMASQSSVLMGPFPSFTSPDGSVSACAQLRAGFSECVSLSNDQCIEIDVSQIKFPQRENLFGGLIVRFTVANDPFYSLVEKKHEFRIIHAADHHHRRLSIPFPSLISHRTWNMTLSLNNGEVTETYACYLLTRRT